MPYPIYCIKCDLVTYTPYNGTVYIGMNRIFYYVCKKCKRGMNNAKIYRLMEEKNREQGRPDSPI
jgi:hypothetical protein